MLAQIKRFFDAIGAFLDDQYRKPPGCCASGGLSAAELEGRRPKASPSLSTEEDGVPGVFK
jgi:hypothetical protein